MGWMSHRNWKETKQQPSMFPGPAVSGCCSISFHYLWAIDPIHPVLKDQVLKSCQVRGRERLSKVTQSVSEVSAPSSRPIYHSFDQIRAHWIYWFTGAFGVLAS